MFCTFNGLSKTKATSCKFLMYISLFCILWFLKLIPTKLKVLAWRKQTISIRLSLFYRSIPGMRRIQISHRTYLKKPQPLLNFLRCHDVVLTQGVAVRKDVRAIFEIITAFLKTIGTIKAQYAFPMSQSSETLQLKYLFCYERRPFEGCRFSRVNCY